MKDFKDSLFCLVSTIKEAYETSTRNNNRFADLINKIKWDAIYTTQDNTTVYVMEDIELEVYSLDPFDSIKPSLMVETEIIYL